MPAKYNTLRVKALSKQFKANTLYIWKVVTNVHLPYLRIVNTDLIDWYLYVNGAAIHAYP